jgi:hypothetical protein
MKQTNTRWFVLALVLLGLLLSTAAVAANQNAPATISDGSVRRQVIQQLINYFADSACEPTGAASEQKEFNLSQPAGDCWLISQTHPAFNEKTNDSLGTHGVDKP